MAELIGQRYEVLRPLGTGGMGDVFLVRDRRDGSEVALKRLRLRDAEATRRFRDEFSILARLEHPNIVRVIDYGLLPEGEGGGAYFTMEALAGQPIDAAIAPGEIDPLLRAVSDIAAGLDALAAVGLVHCDLKPSNVMIVRDANGQTHARLLDFGFVGSLAEWTTRVRGTPGYVAPEVLAGGPYTRASDAYAIGATLYKVLTGRTAFAGASASSVVSAQRTTRPSGLALRALGAPPALESALLGLLDAEPDRRLSAWSELVEIATRQAQRSTGGPGRPRGLGGRGLFVGRAAERDRLRSHLFASRIQLGVVRGASGSGRTRFARELAVEAELGGWGVVWLDADSPPEARAAVGTATGQRGLLLVLDDVDSWSPGALAELDLAGLRPPLTILATVDSARERETWTSALLALSSDPRRWDVELGDLSLDEVGQLVASRLGPRTPPQLAAFIVRHVGALPGPLHQAVDGLLTTAALSEEGGEWALDEAAGIHTIHAGLQSELGSTLSSLDEESRDALLRLAFERPLPGVDDALLSRLQWTGWLAPGNRPALRSPGLADRLRAELLPVVSSRLRAEVMIELSALGRTDARGLRLLAEAQRANQNVAAARSSLVATIRTAGSGEDPDSEAAVEMLLEDHTAGSSADWKVLAEIASLDASRGRSRRAADLWGQVLAGSASLTVDERASIADRRAQALLQVGDYAAALATLDEESPRVGDSGVNSVDWAGRRASALQFLGRIPEAIATLEVALSTLSDSQLLERARLENRLAMIEFLNADGERGRSVLRMAAQHAQEAGNARLIAAIEGNFGLIANMSGDLEEAERRQRLAISGHRQAGNDYEVGNALATLASTLSAAARWDEFDRVCREVVELARTRRDPQLLLNVTATRVLAALRRGRLAEARRLQRTERTWLPTIGRLEAELHHRIFRAELCRLQGREGIARRILREIAAAPGSRRLQRYAALAEAMLGRIESMGSAQPETVQRLDAARLVRADDRLIASIVDLELARLAGRFPTSDQVRHALDRLTSASPAVATASGPYEEARAWHAILSADFDRAAQHFRDAISAHLHVEHRVLALEAGWRAGLALTECQWEREGAELLRGAHELARSLGMRVWAQRIADDILDIESRLPVGGVGSGTQPPEWDTLHRVSEVLNSALEPASLLPRALALVCERMGAERGFILLNAEGEDPQPVAQYGHVDDEARASALDVSRSVLRKVAASGESFRSDDASSDPRLGSTLSVFDLSMRSILCTPLRLGNELIGTIYLENRSAAGQFEEGQLDLVEAFANLVAVAIQNARLHEELRASRDRVLGENLSLRREVSERFRGTNLVGQSAEIERILLEIERVAPSRATVLITGESGTGKDLVAKTIHFASPRASRPFLSLNCAALPPDLIESELFGIDDHVATGVRGRPGIFERADGGTLFLDEIGDMPLGLQAKLLRVLQEREFSRIGGARTIRVDVRLLAATNQDLPHLIEQGKFREDLYFRLHILPLHLPALRERKVDILPLAEHFLHRFCEENSLPVPRLSAGFRSTLLRSDWPGNVRELQNYVERSVVMSPGPVLEPVVLPSDLEPARSRPARVGGPVSPEETSVPPNLRSALEEAERRWILAALTNARGNQRQAAALLGVAEPTLRYRIGKLGVAFEAETARPPEGSPAPPRKARSQKPAHDTRK